MGNRGSSHQQPRACYFSRDLKAGSQGGDVYCLQDFLKQEGLLGEASGFFGEQTTAALSAWQARNRLRAEQGVFGRESRQLYAQKLRLLTPGGPPSAEERRAGSVTGIEVCSELERKKRCRTAYARSPEELPHSCRQACQLAYSDACERVYPPNHKSGALDYKKCMQFMHPNCSATCAAIEQEHPK
mmetsp:Transcript_13982/g.35908  ORF Transcript_13982/g.35908 Transcript_13982/m.35908 type:complete len:186 (-) Transcript_13982:51-608(-)|eukprot:jgi/Tetstr1/463529/TSEL_008408.t1